MSRMLKALQQIEARAPQPPVEAVAPTESPIAQAIETVEIAEAAVAEANAPCLAAAVEATVAEPQEASAVEREMPCCPAEESMEDSSATATPAVEAPVISAPPPLPEHRVAESQSAPIGRNETASCEKALARPFDELAETICAQCSPRAGKVLMFSAPDDESAAVDLIPPLAAALAARIGGDVLLVDANPQQPDLAGQLGVQAVAGLADVLRGAVPWPEAVRETSVPGLFVLSGRGLSQFSSQRKWDCPPADTRGLTMPGLLGELSAKYRMVLIAAPSLARAGVAGLTQHCRGTYLVVRLYRTSRRAVREAARAIDRSGGRLLGCVALAPTARAAF